MNVPHIPRRRHSRRRFLKGAGVCLALPILNEHGSALGAEPNAANRRRMLLISNNLGVLPEPFFPADAGPDYALSPYLERLAAFRNEFTVFSGLSHPAVAGGHSTENCFLTGAKDPTGSGFRNTISLDQYASENLPQETRFRTLNLGVNIDRANRSLSWTRDGVLLPAEDSPARLYRRLFLQGDRADREQRIHELRHRGSILDTLARDLKRYQSQVNSSDRDRLDQYATSIRELEHELVRAEEWEHQPRPSPTAAEPQDILDKSRFFEKFELMLSMARLALETDSTRIVTLMVDAFATPVFEIDDATRSLNGYHNLSHHGQVREKVEQLEMVDYRQMGLLRQLLQELSERREQGVRLLDQSMVLYGSNMGDSNTHENTNLPILLAGGGFKHGQHLRFERHSNTPLSNLFVAMLQRLGVTTDAFASSTSSLWESLARS